MAGEHSVLSPSKGEMILSCAAALGASRGEPNPPSEYAAEGTAYHQISAEVLLELQGSIVYTRKTKCEHYVGDVIEADGFKFTIDDENAAYAQKYVDAVRKLPGAQYYEQWVDTSEVVGVPGQGGTIDCVTCDYEHETLHVSDLKFGRGEIVHAEGNKQLLQYGAAALLKWGLLADWKYLHVEIHQPRVNHYSEHTYPVEEVLAWMGANREKFRLSYHLYENPQDIKPEHFNPTDKGCRWCPIKAKCAARANKMLDLFPIMPDGRVHAVAGFEFDDLALAHARDRVETIEAWCADIKKEAHHRAVVLGKQLPGWKVVQGRRGNRKWDPDQVNAATGQLFTLLQQAAYKPREVISPTDAEKAFKKAKYDFAIMAPFITQSEGALSLERDDSPKPVVAAGLEFPIQEPTA